MAKVNIWCTLSFLIDEEAINEWKQSKQNERGRPRWFSDLATPRAFKIPGNMLVQSTLTTVCYLVIVQALVLFMFPELIDFSVNWRYSAPVLSGVIVTVLVGEYMLKQAELKKRPASENAARPTDSKRSKSAVFELSALIQSQDYATYVKT
ncbi:hypothetical protein Vspart_04332 [Vibrio spartinae]|uniref:Cation-transporting P-type ATPase C-terminal domain-containing protein n=1 Tax=Vibrio spartinae TaxID=1918945 RepID=A0A1N6MBT9_9VIBR|nr:hypothetical protein Vspart_04332 [Vibrio spartinae]SIO96883.1 hypothetical protein VSP9026_04709 [Vibrio spartinae]